MQFPLAHPLQFQTRPWEIDRGGLGACAVDPTTGQPLAGACTGDPLPPVPTTTSTTTTAATTPTSTLASAEAWLTQKTIISSLPNWALLAGGAAAVMLFSKH